MKMYKPLFILLSLAPIQSLGMSTVRDKLVAAGSCIGNKLVAVGKGIAKVDLSKITAGTVLLAAGSVLVAGGCALAVDEVLADGRRDPYRNGFNRSLNAGRTVGLMGIAGSGVVLGARILQKGVKHVVSGIHKTNTVYRSLPTLAQGFTCGLGLGAAFCLGEQLLPQGGDNRYVMVTDGQTPGSVGLL